MWALFGRKCNKKHFEIYKTSWSYIKDGKPSHADLKAKDYGIRICCLPFLFRIALRDMHEVIKLTDALHADQRGFGCERVQRLVIRTGAIFGTPARRHVLDYWCANLRRHGLNGLVQSYRLFTSSETQGKERRTLAESLAMLTQIYPDDPMAKPVCKLMQHRTNIADKRDRRTEFSTSELDVWEEQEKSYVRAIKSFVAALPTCLRTGKGAIKAEIPKVSSELLGSRTWRRVR